MISESNKSNTEINQCVWSSFSYIYFLREKRNLETVEVFFDAEEFK